LKICKVQQGGNMDTETRDKMYKRWLTLCHRLCEMSEKPRRDFPDMWWKELDQRYSEPQRFDHNWNHICDSLNDFYKVRHLFLAPMAAELSIWFHDFIYDIPAWPDKSNEERSMESAIAICNDLQITSWMFITALKRYIMATDHNSERLERLNIDERLLCSIDLARLGQPPHVYIAKYAWPIRQEHKEVPLEVYREKRAEFLAGFLKRPYIYPAQTFRDRLEEQARANIANEIELLHSGQFPTE